MGTRTKVMKTTKNVTIKIIFKMIFSKNIPSILILFYSVAEIARSIIGKWFHSLGRR